MIITKVDVALDSGALAAHEPLRKTVGQKSDDVGRPWQRKEDGYHAPQERHSENPPCMDKFVRFARVVAV